MSKRRRITDHIADDKPYNPEGSDEDSEDYSPRAARRSAGRGENGAVEKKTRRKATERPQGADQIRQTFSKRKKGMVLKAAQLSALSKAKVFVFWANDKGHSWSYSSHNFPKSGDEDIMQLLRRAAGIKGDKATTEAMEHPHNVPAASDDEGPEDDDTNSQHSNGSADPLHRAARPARSLRRPVRFADCPEPGPADTEGEATGSEDMEKEEEEEEEQPGCKQHEPTTDDPMDEAPAAGNGCATRAHGSETASGDHGHLHHHELNNGHATSPSTLTQHHQHQLHQLGLPAGPHPKLRMGALGVLHGMGSPTPSPTSAMAHGSAQPTTTKQDASKQEASLAAGRPRRSGAGNRYKDALAAVGHRPASGQPGSAADEDNGSAGATSEDEEEAPARQQEPAGRKQQARAAPHAFAGLNARNRTDLFMPFGNISLLTSGRLGLPTTEPAAPEAQPTARQSKTSSATMPLAFARSALEQQPLPGGVHLLSAGNSLDAAKLLDIDGLDIEALAAAQQPGSSRAVPNGQATPGYGLEDVGGEGEGEEFLVDTRHSGMVSMFGGTPYPGSF